MSRKTRIIFAIALPFGTALFQWLRWNESPLDFYVGILMGYAIWRLIVDGKIFDQ